MSASETQPLTGGKSSKQKMSKSANSSSGHSSGSSHGHSHAGSYQTSDDLEQGHATYGNGHGHSHGPHAHSHSHSHGGSEARLSPREAYRRGDVDASKRAHEAKREQANSEEGHAGEAGEYIKSIVYGGLDGIITTFATVTSVAGAEFSAAVIVVLGISHLFADGLSMGLGDYMSSQAEEDFTEGERAREQWEMDNGMQGEIEEMVDLYKAKGMAEDDARRILNTMARYPSIFLDNMMVVELGLLPPSADKGFSPAKAGFVTMCSFTAFGSVPLLPYLIALIPGLNMSAEVQLWIAIVSTVLTLFALGAYKAYVVDEGRSAWWKSGALMAANGSLAATVGYLVGYLTSSMMNLPTGAA